MDNVILMVDRSCMEEYRMICSIEISFRFIIIFLFQQHLGPGIGEDDLHLHLTPPSHALVECDIGMRSEW